MQSSSQSLPLELKVETLSTFPFPTSVQQTLKEMSSSHSAIIQRVSEKSFVIRTVTKTFQTPLKLLHVRFDSENNFHCQCSQFKVEKLSSATTAPKRTKRCIHLYICMWAFLSCENLQREFSMYFHQLQPEGMYTITVTVVTCNSFATCTLITLQCQTYTQLPLRKCQALVSHKPQVCKELQCDIIYPCKK